MAAPGDELLEAFDALVVVLEENVRVNREIARRVRAIKRMRDKGVSYTEIVEQEGRPLIVELVTGNLERLRAAGGRLRRLEATVLHDEGLTTEQIAALFGVTRQRVSTLLKEERESTRARRRPRR